MTATDYDRKLDEFDRLLNDPDAPIVPSRVWTLLAEITQQDISLAAAARAAEARGAA